MIRKKKIKTPLLFVVFFVLVTFSIPAAALAADCPCFTAKDVMRFTPPSPLTCIGFIGCPGSYTYMRMNESGEYFAYFSTSGHICAGCMDDMYCEAYGIVGDFSSPQVVLYGDEFGYPIHIALDSDQVSACNDILLNTHAERISDCNFECPD